MGLLSDVFTNNNQKEELKEDTVIEFIVADKALFMREGYETFYLMSDKGKVYIGGRYIKENIFVFKNIKIGDRVRSTIPYGKYEDYWSRFEIIRSVSDNK